jgi:hypothetical protein
MFDFTIDPKITREYLLSKHNEETYMSFYLGLEVKKGLYKSPLRVDNHKTCSFFRGKSGVLYFKDFATGQCLSFESVVMEKFKCNYHEALKIIAKDFGFIKGSTPKPIKVQPVYKEEKQTFIQIEAREFSEHEYKWWLDFGISKDILKRFNIFSCKTVFLNGNIFAQSTQHFPIFGYYFGKKENIEQWRIYMPSVKHGGIRFIGNCSAKTIQGFKQLPKKGKLVVITKSMKDCMTLYSFGIPAIAPCSENLFIADNILDELKTRFKYIVVLYDNDLPGISNMRKIRKEHPELNYCFISRKYGTKDISDTYKKYGRDKTKKIIEEYIKYLKTK